MNRDVDLSLPPMPGLFPAALWIKCLREAWFLLTALVLVLVVFNLIFVWLSSQVNLGALGIFLKQLPASFERVAGVPFANIATPTGRLAMAYVDPVTIFVAVSWSIARGSDCISGEIGRGTMELLLAQPVRRASVVVVHAVVTVSGAALLAATAYTGMSIGVRITRLAAEVDTAVYAPSALNLFGFMFFLIALGTLVSSLGNDRRRTVGILAGFYIVQLLMKIVGRAIVELHWLKYGTFLTLFEPQALAVHPDTAWRELAWSNGGLIGLGLACYFLATCVFCRRDLPAPL